MNGRTVKVYEEPPLQFQPQVEVASCYIEIDGQLLLLQRSLEKSAPGLWGVPAGKLEKQETPENAAKRELFEETGISLEHPFQIQSIGPLYICKPDGDFIYHLFKINLSTQPSVCLSDEHQNYKWASQKDIETLPLIPGAKEALQKYRAFRPGQANTVVSV